MSKSKTIAKFKSNEVFWYIIKIANMQDFYSYGDLNGDFTY